MNHFLQELKGRYGEVGLNIDFNRWGKRFTKLFGGHDSRPTPKNIPAPTKEIPKIIVPKPPNKFCPVNIATLDDWRELREEALRLDELEIFFTGRTDSQSPMFLSLIKEYKKTLEKNLKPPEEIDEESSFNFVEKFSSALEKKFLTMVESCRSGKAGKGKNPPIYYVQVERHLKKYFEHIGLQVENVEPHSNFRDVQEHMKATIIPTDRVQDFDKIEEIVIPPSFFKYHDDSGEILKYWIDGKCTVWQKGGA